MTEEDVKNALRTVKYPGYSRDIVSFGLVKQISVNGGAVSVSMQLTSGTPEVVQQIKIESERALKALPGVNMVHVEVKPPTGPQAAGAGSPWQNQNKVPGIQRIVAVASGKGGVGKSTASVNLACALKHLGARVGLLDCDIYGPSIPLMMGTRQKPTVTEDQSMMVPPVAHGVKLMSMGFLIEGDSPVIWRGPMIMKTIQQFVTSVGLGRTGLFAGGPAAGNGGRAAIALPDRAAGRGRHHHDAAGGVAGGGAEGDCDVRESERADSGDCGEHELFHDTNGRTSGDFRTWGRPCGGGAAKHPIFGRNTAFYGNPGGGRCRCAGGGVRP